MGRAAEGTRRALSLPGLSPWIGCCTCSSHDQPRPATTSHDRPRPATTTPQQARCSGGRVGKRCERDRYRFRTHASRATELVTLARRFVWAPLPKGGAATHTEVEGAGAGDAWFVTHSTILPANDRWCCFIQGGNAVTGVALAAALKLASPSTIVARFASTLSRSCCWRASGMSGCSMNFFSRLDTACARQTRATKTSSTWAGSAG